MKVTGVETFLVDDVVRNWVFVRVHTDQGVSGVGESTTEWSEKAVEAAIGHLQRYLVGKNPFDIEAHFQRMYRDAYWRSGPVVNSAISGIEQALWDIIGKQLEVPVYKLLGGRCRDKIRVYANGWYEGLKTPEEFADAAADVVKKGYTALKWDPFGASDLVLERDDAKAAVKCVEAVREAVGDDVELLIEGHGRLNINSAVQVAKDLEPFRPYFFEEPIPSENVDALAKVAAKTNIPIATGERLFTKFGFREVLEKQAADIIQPDPCHDGGILETKKIAAMAETYYVPVAPHNPNGPVATAASIQLATCIPNFVMLEGVWEWDVPWRSEVVTEPFTVHNGYVEVPNRPGLGVELDEEVISKHPFRATDQFLWLSDRKLRA